jgi:hypothetical protein
MEDYSCDDISQSPHAIDCGHIFCRTCIRGFIPKVCPLCRKSFTIGRKLHVDAGEGTNPAPSGIDAHSSALLERIALVFDEASTAEDVTVVITEANDWIYAHSDWDDPSSFKPLRLAVEALCRYRSCLDSAEDLATLRAMESSLRMQLLEDREAASMLQNKLQTDLKVMSGKLQAERDRFITELLAEREASAQLRQERQNILREAAGNIHTLRVENRCLHSEIQNTQMKERLLTLPEIHPATTPLHIDRPQLSGQSSPAAETFKSRVCSYTPQNSQPVPYMDSYSSSVDKIYGHHATKAAGAASVHVLPISRKPFHRDDVSDPSKPLGSSGSSSLEDVYRELQDRSQVALANNSMGRSHGQLLKHFPSFDPQTLPLSRNQSPAAQVLPSAPKRSRRLLKMVSTPAFRKNGDRYIPGVDKHDLGISAAAGNQMPKSSNTKDHKSLAQRWPHSWRIF